jgi:hypothetical protein
MGMAADLLPTKPRRLLLPNAAVLPRRVGAATAPTLGSQADRATPRLPRQACEAASAARGQ